MSVVNMSINSEEPFKNNFNYLDEVFRESYTFIKEYIPNCEGNIVSLFSWFSTQVIKYSIYSAAETFKGVFTFVPSAHRYSYFGPADITGHESCVQNSINIPYNRLTMFN